MDRHAIKNPARARIVTPRRAVLRFSQAWTRPIASGGLIFSMRSGQGSGWKVAVMTPKIYVTQLEPNTHIQTTFMVSAHALRQTKHGEPYLCLTLTDRTGAIEARAWEHAALLAARCAPQDIVRVHAQVTTYQGIPQLKLLDLERVPPETVDRLDFMAASRWPAESMFVQLKDLLNEHVKSPAVLNFLRTLLAHDKLAAHLKQAPAATSNHHNYLGGLLEHVLSMARMACMLCDHYARYYPGLLDRDLVIAGCILHDIGKCEELSWECGFEYTTQGQLIGHIPRGIELIEEAARRMDPAPPDGLLLQLKHLVLSHHGKLEYGSPVRPRTPEAILLHELDMIDSRMSMCFAVAKSAPAASPERPERWTEHHRALETRLYLGNLDDESWRAPIPHETHTLTGPGQVTPLTAPRHAQPAHEPALPSPKHIPITEPARSSPRPALAADPAQPLSGKG
jgi:3'-5' exoribonuclease